jgi:hypothetical protein
MYGIDRDDLSSGERIRWEYAAFAVVFASVFSAVGIWHLIEVSTGNEIFAILGALACFVGIGVFDRAMTAPTPDFTRVDLDGYESPEPEGRAKHRIRFVFSFLLLGIGGLGLALLINAPTVDAAVNRKIQADQLALVQDKTATYFAAVVADRDATLIAMCATEKSNVEDREKWVNLAEGKVQILNGSALEPAIDAFAGSHALDLLVDRADGQVEFRSATADDLGDCPRAMRLSEADPLASIFNQRYRGASQVTRGNRSGPSLADAASYHDAVSGTLKTAEADLKKARADIKDPGTGWQPLQRKAALEHALQRQRTMLRMEVFSSRWVDGLREEIDTPRPVDRASRILSQDLVLFFVCIAVVAFFDLSPLVIARFGRPGAGRETLEQRLAREEALDTMERDRSMRDRAAAIGSSPGDPQLTEKITRRLSHLNGPVPPLQAAPAIPVDVPITGEDGVPRRIFIKTAGATAAALTLGGGAWQYIASRQAASAGMALLKQLAESFGLEIALDVVGRVTGITSEKVTSTLFGPDIKPEDLDRTFRPDTANSLTYAATGGGFLYGIGSRNSASCYPTFLSSATDLAEPILLAPHWLNVISSGGDQLMVDPVVGGALAQQALFPTRWTAGDPNVPRSGAQQMQQQITGEWETAAGRVHAALMLTETAPPRGTVDRGPGVVTESRASCILRVEPDSTAIGDASARLRARIEIDDIPVPTLWT